MDPPPHGPRVPVLSPFPILEYLAFLLRRGDLVAVAARREGEPPSEIKPEEWATLGICPDPLHSRLGVFLNDAPRPWVETMGKRYFSPTLFNLRIQRADALRIFPADAPVAPSAPPTNPTAEIPSDEGIENLIRAVERDLGRQPSQNHASKIVQAKFPSVNRDSVRVIHKRLYGPPKPGPKGPRKKRAVVIVPD
jgi:hypothetical protein